MSRRAQLIPHSPHWTIWTPFTLTFMCCLFSHKHTNDKCKSGKKLHQSLFYVNSCVLLTGTAPTKETWNCVAGCPASEHILQGYGDFTQHSNF